MGREEELREIRVARDLALQELEQLHRDLDIAETVGVLSCVAWSEGCYQAAYRKLVDLSNRLTELAVRPEDE